MTWYVPFGASNTSSGAPFSVLIHKMINKHKARQTSLKNQAVVATCVKE
jgi:hypothetical protein